MSIREKIMDKYWLEFLDGIEGDINTSTYVGRIDNTQFWSWFYENKVKKTSQPLEDYLK